MRGVINAQCLRGLIPLEKGINEVLYWLSVSVIHTALGKVSQESSLSLRDQRTWTLERTQHH